jgi:hypothetical protein
MAAIIEPWRLSAQTINHAARLGNGNCMIYAGQPLRVSHSGA